MLWHFLISAQPHLMWQHVIMLLELIRNVYYGNNIKQTQCCCLGLKWCIFLLSYKFITHPLLVSCQSTFHNASQPENQTADPTFHRRLFCQFSDSCPWYFHKSNKVFDCLYILASIGIFSLISMTDIVYFCIWESKMSLSIHGHQEWCGLLDQYLSALLFLAPAEL